MMPVYSHPIVMENINLVSNKIHINNKRQFTFIITSKYKHYTLYIVKIQKKE